MKPALKWGIAAASGAAVFLALRKMKKAQEQKADNTQLALQQLVESSQANNFVIDCTNTPYEKLSNVISNVVATGLNYAVIAVGNLVGLPERTKYYYLQIVRFPNISGKILISASEVESLQKYFGVQLNGEIIWHKIA